MDDHVLGQIHHAVIVGICLINLNGGELRIVSGVHAFVAEDTTDLIDTLHAADNQSLQMQLGRNAHVHVDVQRVVMRDKRTRSSTARNRVQTRCLYFHKALAVTEVADFANDLRAILKGAAHFRIDNQIHVTAAIANIGVLQTVPLFRQRAQGLRQQLELVHANGNFALLGAEYFALDADDIANVILLKLLVLLGTQQIALDAQLDAAIPVGDVREGQLAHDALAHHAACQTDDFAFHLLEVLGDVRGIVGAVKPNFRKRILALLLHCLQFCGADLILFGFRANRLCVLRLALFSSCVLIHVFPPNYNAKGLSAIRSGVADSLLLVLVYFWMSVMRNFTTLSFGASTSTTSPTL